MAALKYDQSITAFERDVIEGVLDGRYGRRLTHVAMANVCGVSRATEWRRRKAAAKVA